MTVRDRGAGVAWITGASQGLGRATALRLARTGWTVIASARSADELARLANLPEARGNIVPLPVDVTEATQVAARLAQIETTHGPVDLAILNAGGHASMPLEDFSIASVRALVELNLMGVVNCLEPLLHRMSRQRRGQVAVVGSLAGYRGLPTAAGYGATKAGLINMVEALRPEAERAGIKLQLVSPGFVKTPLTDLNRFPMPFLMDVDAAAERLVRGLSSRRFEIVFPRRFGVVMKLLRLLPSFMLFAVTRRMLPRKENSA
jgi:short-subunit dehydrogenase